MGEGTRGYVCYGKRSCWMESCLSLVEWIRVVACLGLLNSDIF